MPRGVLNEQSSIVIARPLEDVFAFVSNPTNDPRWCPTVRDPRQLGTGEPTVGAEYEFMHKPSPVKWAPIKVEITELVPPKVFGARSTDSQGFYDYRYELEPVDSGTMITHRTESNFTGPLRLVAPLLKGHLQKVMSGQLNNLKELLENDASK
jgi:uncharacterized protein YndB with AHSA1/START domain